MARTITNSRGVSFRVVSWIVLKASFGLVVSHSAEDYRLNCTFDKS